MTQATGETVAEASPYAFAARMALLYSAMFSFAGLMLPYFPLWLKDRGLDFHPDRHGAVAAAGSARAHLRIRLGLCRPRARPRRYLDRPDGRHGTLLRGVSRCRRLLADPRRGAGPRLLFPPAAAGDGFDHAVGRAPLRPRLRPDQDVGVGGLHHRQFPRRLAAGRIWHDRDHDGDDRHRLSWPRRLAGNAAPRAAAPCCQPNSNWLGKYLETHGKPAFHAGHRGLRHHPGHPCDDLRLRLHPLGSTGILRQCHRPVLGNRRAGGDRAVPVLAAGVQARHPAAACDHRRDRVHAEMDAVSAGAAALPAMPCCRCCMASALARRIWG